MLFCKAIHKGMPRAKWPRQNFNLVNALLIHSWASVKPGIQLMDALFNYACFTFQNKKLLRCPSILPVGEQPEWMGRVMHRQNMKESCCISVVQKVSLANQTQECNSYNSVFNTLMSMDQDQLESRLQCPQGRDIYSRYASNPLQLFSSQIWETSIRSKHL